MNTMTSEPEDQTFDIVIVGSGLKEFMLFGFLSGCEINEAKPKIVLISENKMLQCSNLGYSYFDLHKFKNKEEDPSKSKKELIKEYEVESEWHIDIIPKFFLNKERLKAYFKNFLELEDLNFKSIDGSLILKVEDSIFSKSKSVLWKIPTSTSEFTSVSTQHLGRFIKDCMARDVKKPSEDAFLNDNFDSCIKNYKMDKFTSDIIGRGMCFYHSDEFKEVPNKEIIERVQLYFKACDEGTSSTKRNPFSYPNEGLQSIAEAFCMMGAFNEGKIMIESEVKGVSYDLQQKFKHIILNDGSIIRGKYLIIEPSIAIKLGIDGKIKETTKLALRTVHILNKPISKCKNTNNCVVILPNKDNDTFITMLGNTHSICKPGFYVAVVSTLIDINSSGEEETRQANEIIGNSVEKFNFKLPYFEKLVPTKEEPIKDDNVFVTSSLDITPYFKNDIEDIENIYYSITKKNLAEVIGTEE